MNNPQKHPPWRSSGHAPLQKVTEKRVTFRMPPEQVGRVKAVLKYNGITMSVFIREAVSRLLSSEECFMKEEE